MTPEAQQIAIAEVRGWKDVLVYRDGEAWGIRNAETLRSLIPDHLNDLNAMHGVEIGLTEQQRREYCLWLTDLTRDGTYFPQTYGELFPIVVATAAQRAEAFLRTIGKWADD